LPANVITQEDKERITDILNAQFMIQRIIHSEKEAQTDLEAIDDSIEKAAAYTTKKVRHNLKKLSSLDAALETIRQEEKKKTDTLEAKMIATKVQVEAMLRKF